MNNALDFVHVSTLRTTPATLWRALIEPEFTRQYWGRSIESDWRLGATVTHHLADGTVETGTVVEWDPPRRMAYTFEHDDADLNGTRVTMVLEPQGDAVKLTVIHEGLTAPAQRAVSSGWPGVLANLKTGFPIEATRGPVQIALKTSRPESLGSGAQVHR